MNTMIGRDRALIAPSRRRPKTRRAKLPARNEILASPVQPRLTKPPAKPARDSIFISYAHGDERWLRPLSVMLSPLSRKYSIRIWSDQHISPGEDWKKSIETELRRAKVAILLASPEFLASEFIHSNELPRLLDAAANEQCTILWIPLKACLYEETELSRYQAVSDPNRPLDCLNTARRGQVFRDVASRIKFELR